MDVDAILQPAMAKAIRKIVGNPAGMAQPAKLFAPSFFPLVAPCQLRMPQLRQHVPIPGLCQVSSGSTITDVDAVEKSFQTHEANKDFHIM